MSLFCKTEYFSVILEYLATPVCCRLTEVSHNTLPRKLFFGRYPFVKNKLTNSVSRNLYRLCELSRKPTRHIDFYWEKYYIPSYNYKPIKDFACKKYPIFLSVANHWNLISKEKEYRFNHCSRDSFSDYIFRFFATFTASIT